MRHIHKLFFCPNGPITDNLAVISRRQIGIAQREYTVAIGGRRFVVLVMVVESLLVETLLVLHHLVHDVCRSTSYCASSGPNSTQ